MRPAPVLGLPVLGLPVLALPALMLLAAAPGPRDVEEAERARVEAGIAARDAASRAELQAAEADRLATARVTEAAALRATEDRISDLSERIAALQARHDAAVEAARARARQLAPLLPLAERLGLYPAETLVTVATGPEDAVRGILVLQGMARRIRASVADLAVERVRADAMLQVLEQTRGQLATAASRQHGQATALDARIAEAERRRDLARDAAAQAAQQAASEATRTASLKAAIATLDAVPRTEPRGGQAERAPSPVPVATTSKGGWTVPVAGRVTSGFGAATDAGPASGITVQAPPGGRVVSPCRGRVVFAGPFRSYGQLMIVQCGAGLHAVLAGLDRLDAAIGQKVQSGEPIGVMARDGGALYIEIRRAGTAVDPGQYLRRPG